MRQVNRVVRAVLISLLCSPALGQPEPPAMPPSKPTRAPDAPGMPDSPSDRKSPDSMPATVRPRTQQRRPPENPDQPMPVPDTLEVVRDVVYAQAPADGAEGRMIDLTLDAAFLRQSDGKPMPVIVYIHGGGYVGGSKEAGLKSTYAFAQGGYFAVTINYRLAQQARFPAAVRDCKAAIRFLRANAQNLAIDPDRIGVWGHSAGGHLSALVGTSGNSDALDGPAGAPGSPGSSSAVACVADFSGPVDFLTLFPTAESNDGQRRRASGGRLDSVWFGKPIADAPDLAARANPVTYIDAHDPPFLIVHGTEDPLVPIAQSELLNEALKKGGVEVTFLPIDGAGHGIADLEAYRKLAEFFDAHLHGNAVAAAREIEQRMDDRDPRPGQGPDPDRQPPGQ